MKHSITSAEKGHRLWAVAFWLVAWQIAAMCVGQKLLLASPWETIVRWVQLVPTGGFWQSIFFTLGHILLGFCCAALCGTFLAALSVRFRLISQLFAPILAVIRSVPVASFVIVALIWIPSRNLSVLISFLIALPIIHADVLGGILQVDSQLIEMARVFRMSSCNRLLHLYLPSVLPRFRSSASVAIGLAWKSGVAAEVIGIPSGSIGEKLYKAKIYLATPDLFAWTLTIILLSMLCEWLLNLALRTAQKKLERM